MSTRYVYGGGVWRDPGSDQLVPTSPCQNELGSSRPTIPRAWAEEAHREYAEQYGTVQSLERLEERGGFGLCEIISLLMDALNRARQER